MNSVLGLREFFSLILKHKIDRIKLRKQKGYQNCIFANIYTVNSSL